MPVALVTGATGAIGKAIARQLAERGLSVIVAARNEAKARSVVADVRRTTGNDRVRLEVVDLSCRDSVRDLARRLRGPLDVLVNNAAETPRRRQETADGIEVQFATNVLGYFWMTRELEPALREAAPSRVVNVASYWAGDLELDDLQFVRRRYDNNTAYRQSKQADRMLTVAFAERLERDRIAVNACHPGDVSSKLSNDLGFGGHESPDRGAETPVWLATTDGGSAGTGKYYEHRRETACRFGADRHAVQRLFEECLRFA